MQTRVWVMLPPPPHSAQSGHFGDCQAPHVPPPDGQAGDGAGVDGGGGGNAGEDGGGGTVTGPASMEPLMLPEMELPSTLTLTSMDSENFRPK